MRLLFVACLLALVACPGANGDRQRVLLVTTHSVEDSGLLEELTAAFHADHAELRLVTTAVGSGAALELGRRGDADVLLTHDPDGEAEFMALGDGLEQGPVMENAFLLVGPPGDPAGIAGGSDAVAAFRAIAAMEARFLSRGDDSGTHRKERELWRAAGLDPWSTRPSWYLEAGLGMAETLQAGTQLDAYLVTDEATFRHLDRSVRLVPMVVSDRRFRNPYVYTLPRRQMNPDGARLLANWLAGPGQEVIARYGADRFGRPLFEPTAVRETPAADPADRRVDRARPASDARRAAAATGDG
jgi:tungstate transport system substrate-binding protein